MKINTTGKVSLDLPDDINNNLSMVVHFFLAPAAQVVSFSFSFFFKYVAVCLGRRDHTQATK